MSTYKPFQIVVHNDFDGGASAICVIEHIRQKYGPDAKYGLWFGTYKNVDQYVERLMDWPEKFEKVFIADIHTHPDLAKDFPKNFMLFDHHSSAMDLANLPQCIIDARPTVCGATLCYKHLLIDEKLEFKHLTKLVAIANDYDNWHHKLPNNIAKNVNFLFYKNWGEKFVERFQNGFDKFTEEENEFIKKKWEEIDEQIKTTNYIDLIEKPYDNKICMIVMPDDTKGEVNELCDHVLTKMGYSAIISVVPKKHKVSIRANAYAEEKGLHVGNTNVELDIGGGHARAGGGQYEDEAHLKRICETYMTKIVDLGI